MESTTESKSAGKPINLWMIATGVLAVAVLVLAAFDNPFASKVERVNPVTASQSLSSFINTIYGEQVGPATVVGTTEEHGLYKVTLQAANQDGQPLTQDVYVSLDGKMFIPEAHDMADVLGRFDEYQQAIKNGTVDPNAPAPAAGTMEAGSTTTVSGEDAAAL